MNIVSRPVPSEIAARLTRPTVRLSGPIDEYAVSSFFAQITPVLDIPGSIVLELYTPGGDAEVARRLSQEIRLLSEVQGRDMWFLGKTLVASAGVTVMSAFPIEKRWLTRDATLLVHGRRMFRDLRLDGPLGSCRRVLEEMIADIDNGLRVEEETLHELVAGSGVSLDYVKNLSYGGWYLSAQQALDVGLIGGIV